MGVKPRCPPPAPTLTSFTPTSGAVGTTVTLTGSGFTGASSVAINGTLASSFTVVSATQLTAVVPQGATSGHLSVTTPGGSATSSGSFTVTSAPPPPPPSTTTTTAYYGGGLAESVNGTLSYLLSDPVLGSASASVNLSGQVVASQLYSPYGSVRYASGILPTDIGFTHQRADATTGLDDYSARWYDPLAGQFASADTLLPKSAAQPDPGQLNRYAYVAGNPETKSDPSGHYLAPSSGGGAQRLDPVPGRTNFHDDFVRDYWTDTTQGNGGYSDWLWKQSVKKSLERDSRSSDQKAEDALMAQDGPTLAAWFGLTMWRTPDFKGAGGPSPDLYVGINQGVRVSGAGPLLVADPTDPKYATGIELYKPQSGTDWLALPGGRPAGIIGEAYLKGAQASIVAIDISAKDPKNQLDQATLNGYAAQIVYWQPTTNPKGSSASRVVRVIFISNGAVVDDYNPEDFGPPNRATRPMQILES